MVNVLVPLGEFKADLLKQLSDLVFRERHDPGDDSGGALGIPGTKRP